MTTEALPTPNLPLLRKVLSHIDAHPDEWVQRAWMTVFLPEHTAQYAEAGVQVPECGTAFCIAGHALAQSGINIRTSEDTESLFVDRDTYVTVKSGLIAESPNGLETIENAAQRVLGLTDDEADALFEGHNDRCTVQYVAERIAKRAGERL